MGVLALDDRDPSIVYSPGWAQAGSSLEYNSTTSWTAVAGSTAKVPFRGTSVGVYGTIPAGTVASVAPVSAYSIDGGAPILFRAAQGATAQYHRLFFQSPVLPDGQHQLTVAHPILSDPLFLDFLMIVQTSDASISLSATSSTTSSTTSTTTSTTSAAPSSTVVNTPVPVTVTVTSVVHSAESSPTAIGADGAAASPSGSAVSATVNTGKSSNGGAIAGGIIAVIVVLFLLAFGYIFWRRRRGKRSSVIASNFWNTGSSTTAPSQPFALATPPLSNKPVMSQASTPQPYDPRYPGGYTPGPINPGQPYTNYAPAASAHTFTPSSENTHYGQPQGQGYPSRAYLPPSQLMNPNPNNDYNLGMPIPTNNPNYVSEVQVQAGPRTRIRLD
ncbi:hypothetical protein BDZ97DRAFT_1925699 [Flammula alnicola]|nr:hypothetical protein BDZ97DRAFT_1925699 [Flammula alnicola]